MAFDLVTCPQTGATELIDHHKASGGVRVRWCSRFHPACVISCATACGAQVRGAFVLAATSLLRTEPVSVAGGDESA